MSPMNTPTKFWPRHPNRVSEEEMIEKAGNENRTEPTSAGKSLRSVCARTSLWMDKETQNEKHFPASTISTVQHSCCCAESRVGEEDVP